MCSGRVDEGHVGNGFGDEFGVVPGEVVHHGVGGVVGPATGSVGQKMIDGHISDVLLVRGLAIFCAENAGGTEDFVCKVELALFDQGEDGDGGDGHSDGSDAEEAGLLDLGEMLSVAHPDGLVVDELAVAGDGDGRGGNGELPAEGGGDAAHLATLLTVGSPVLSLRECFEMGTGMVAAAADVRKFLRRERRVR